MEEGFNSGRKCPWSKEYLTSLYKKVDNYSKEATLYALKTEGPQVASETMSAYSMFKYPIVYIIVHYHYGDFESLRMSQNDIMSYLMMFLPMVTHFAKNMMEGMKAQKIFDFDRNNEINPALISVCDEILRIEENS